MPLSSRGEHTHSSTHIIKTKVPPNNIYLCHMLTTQIFFSFSVKSLEVTALWIDFIISCKELLCYMTLGKSSFSSPGLDVLQCKKLWIGPIDFKCLSAWTAWAALWHVKIYLWTTFKKGHGYWLLYVLFHWEALKEHRQIMAHRPQLFYHESFLIPQSEKLCVGPKPA